jgi:hypothetical protein
VCLSTKLRGAVVTNNTVYFRKLIPKTYSSKTCVSVLTDAHPRTLTEWNIRVVRSTAFDSVCETISTVLGSTSGHSEGLILGYKPRYRWKCYCSISISGRQFVVITTLLSRNGNDGYFLSVSVNTATVSGDVKYKWISGWYFGT